jgi:glycosyltransferase involved in cell wall biosynthesis
MSRSPLKVTAFLNAYTSGASGGDTRFVEVFKRIKGVDLTVVTPGQGVSFTEEGSLLAEYLVTSERDSESNVIFSYPTRALRAIALLSGRDLGVLYATSDFFPDVFPSFIMRRRGAQWVQLVHHLIPGPRKRDGGLARNTLSFVMQRLSLVLIKMRADTVVVVSEGVRMSLVDMGFEPSRVHVNPNGVDIPQHKGMSAKGPGYDGVFLARLHRSKGVLDLVKIWRIVCDRHPDARLAIIGDGPEEVKKELTDLIVSSGIQDNVTLLGYLPKDQALGILGSSKVFLFPSHEEGFGIAALEAMACGLPVVGWDLDVYHDVFGTGGIVTVSMGDHHSFAREVDLLLTDEGVRGKVSKAAGLTAQRYDWRKIAEQELALLTSGGSAAGPSAR